MANFLYTFYSFLFSSIYRCLFFFILQQILHYSCITRWIKESAICPTFRKRIFFKHSNDSTQQWSQDVRFDYEASVSNAEFMANRDVHWKLRLEHIIDSNHYFAVFINDTYYNDRLIKNIMVYTKAGQLCVTNCC